MKHRKQVQQIASHVLVAVVTTVVVLAITAAGAPQAPNQSKLDALQELITDRFIGESDKVLMEDAAAHAMIGALGDQWSYYIPADEFAAYQEQKENSYVGIGVTISVRQDGTGLDVLLVTPGGSAEEVGILAGDIIVGVNGQSIVGMDVSAVGNMIRGEAETTVDVTVSRGGQELTMTVTRRQIATPVAVATLLENNIGLIRIENFNTNCAKETIAAIEELMGQGADKLIFDVRNNPGGYAHELVDVLDHLLPEGELFRTEDYTGKQAVEKSDADCLQLPMAVLVNGNSYSAAEFFAAALSEYEWAEVVGEKTTGKGYYQVTYQFSDGSAVGLSVGKYYTPKGISLAGVGITPDVLVPVDQETANAIYAQTLEPEKDPQIQAAVKKLLEGE
jgi:carboxyl-terminal processing protease